MNGKSSFEGQGRVAFYTWIVPGQIRKANLCRGLGNRYTPAGTEVLISAVAHNTPPSIQV